MGVRDAVRFGSRDLGRKGWKVEIREIGGRIGMGSGKKDALPASFLLERHLDSLEEPPLQLVPARGISTS